MGGEQHVKNKITLGAVEFTDDRIASAQAALDADLSERTMTVDTAVALLSTEDRRRPMAFFTSEPFPFYTADNRRFYTAPTGEAPPDLDALDQTQAVSIYRGGSLFISFFPRKLRRASAARAELSMTSALGLLEQMEHRGGIYTGTTTAGNLLREICGSVPVFVSSVFENVPVYGWLPYVSPSGVAGARKGSAKDNFLKVCFKLNASVRAAPDGTLRVENLPTAVASVFDRSRIYRENFQVEDLPPVSTVTVIEHQYLTGSASKELFSGATTAGQIIIFSEPCSNLVATGFSITESGANYAVVSAGSGTLTGVPYVHTTREITRTVTENAPAENAVRIEDATLVDITSSADVANRLAAYYACRKYINCDATIEFEDAGNVVSIWDNVAKQMRQACLEAISPLNFSNTLKGHVKALVGFTPWQTVPFDDERVVLTEDGTYTFPEDIEPGTKVQVVLIGGGQAGANGGNGVAGTADPKEVHFTKVPFSFSSTSGKGGDGGAAGVHGSGGSIYRAELTVDPGDSFAFTIGAGGASNGALGGNTTFGALSSANGTPGGYFDTVAQIQYGRDGTDGVAGAKGGDGGTGSATTAEGNNGKPGGDVGGNTGGAGGKGAYSKWLHTGNDGSYEGLGGGGGGGAAKGANGSKGVDQPGSYGDTQYGGAGGNAELPATAENYGDGGFGGNGGGGGGGAPGYHGYAGSDTPVPNTFLFRAVGGAGGRGSAGSAGRQGCVILIFRKPAQE